MERDDTVIDTVERLERAVSRLERILDGDKEIASPGVLTQHRLMVEDVAAMKARQPSALMWAIGYAIYSSGLFLLIKEVRDYLGIVPGVTAIIVFVAVAVALFFFVNGLGFVKWVR
mgnify:CR=1 FL=1